MFPVWIAVLIFVSVVSAYAQTDPGLRGGDPGAGGPLPGLSADQQAAFELGLEDFNEEEGVGDGLGPRFNLDSCGGCHVQPAVGGSSPRFNPQVRVARDGGAQNTIPRFITRSGPVREVRFRRRPDGSPDGGVHQLFVISGRKDAPPDGGDARGCHITQENFNEQDQAGNLTFRVPTAVFGGGLLEGITDDTITTNAQTDSAWKSQLGIGGRPHQVSGGIGRFGWKAQHRFLLNFSGEAYNVEMGISNELSPQELETDPNCQFADVPNDVPTPPAPSGVENFTNFMKLLAAPQPSLTTPGGPLSIARGRLLFTAVGCNLCHTPALPSRQGPTGPQVAQLFSDLLIHKMGALNDGVSQGEAQPDEFRTPPLWGLGQRIFFLHDGRTTDLVEAIRAHRSPGSEANAVIERVRQLNPNQVQDLLNFLRSL